MYTNAKYRIYFECYNNVLFIDKFKTVGNTDLAINQSRKSNT